MQKRFDMTIISFMFLHRSVTTSCCYYFGGTLSLICYFKHVHPFSWHVLPFDLHVFSVHHDMFPASRQGSQNGCPKTVTKDPILNCLPCLLWLRPTLGCPNRKDEAASLWRNLHSHAPTEVCHYLLLLYLGWKEVLLKRIGRCSFNYKLTFAIFCPDPYFPLDAAVQGCPSTGTRQSLTF